MVLNPWLSCGPRGIDPPCPACEAGDYNLCWHFTDGRLSPGIHTGNAKEATGGFAPRLPAHDSMLVPVPDAIPDDVAVMADPFSVSLHAVTRTPPPRGGRCVVYGAGALVLGVIFGWAAYALWRETTKRRAVVLFHYSLLYLALLFVAMALDVVV